MKLLIDMNLAPRWVQVFEDAGNPAAHWTDIRPGDAPDSQIMRHAHDHGYCVLTHDLDFGAILAASGTASPSVVQVRTDDVSPEALTERLLAILREYESVLVQGALMTLDPARLRVRILPLGRSAPG